MSVVSSMPTVVMRLGVVVLLTVAVVFCALIVVVGLTAFAHFCKGLQIGLNLLYLSSDSIQLCLSLLVLKC